MSDVDNRCQFVKECKNRFKGFLSTKQSLPPTVIIPWKGPYHKENELQTVHLNSVSKITLVRNIKGHSLLVLS